MTSLLPKSSPKKLKYESGMAPSELESEEEEETEPGPMEEDGVASLAPEEQPKEQDETNPSPSGLGRVASDGEQAQADQAREERERVGNGAEA